MPTITLELDGRLIRTIEKGELLVSQNRDTIWINDEKKCVLRIQKKK